MSDKKVFGREDILAAKNKRNVIAINDVPDLDGSVFILELKRSEFTEWLNHLAEDDAASIARILCDASGALLFDAANADDIKLINESMTTRQLGHLLVKGMSMNSAKPEAFEKNLQASLNAALNSDLPPISAAPSLN